MFLCLFRPLCLCYRFLLFFFFFNDTAPTEIYTLSLHDALPILLTRRRRGCGRSAGGVWAVPVFQLNLRMPGTADRKSTRLNSSHEWISYAVFCLKKKKKKQHSNS